MESLSTNVHPPIAIVDFTKDVGAGRPGRGGLKNPQKIDLASLQHVPDFIVFYSQPDVQTFVVYFINQFRIVALPIAARTHKLPKLVHGKTFQIFKYVCI